MKNKLTKCKESNSFTDLPSSPMQTTDKDCVTQTARSASDHTCALASQGETGAHRASLYPSAAGPCCCALPLQSLLDLSPTAHSSIPYYLHILEMPHNIMLLQLSL